MTSDPRDASGAPAAPQPAGTLETGLPAAGDLAALPPASPPPGPGATYPSLQPTPELWKAAATARYREATRQFYERAAAQGLVAAGAAAVPVGRLRDAMAGQPEAIELEEAQAGFAETVARLSGFAPAPGEVLAFPAPGLPSGCAHRDPASPSRRECLACGAVWCPECQPEGGGGPCRKCRGPVYAADEARPPGGPNPANGAY